MDRLFNAVLAGIAEGATYGLIALGIVLVYKATRVLNFAQAEIGTIAVYVTWWLSERAAVPVPVFAAALIAVVIAGGLGATTEVILRPLAAGSRLTMTVATLGLATFLGYSQVLMFGPDPQQQPALISGRAFDVGRVEFTWGRLMALAITLSLGLALFAFLKRTLFGLGVLAAAQDQTALKLMGLPFNQVSTFTWSAGAILTALAGIILAPIIGSFTPFFITTSLFIPSLAAALIGGLTSLPGAFVGGLSIGIVQNIAKFYGNEIPGAEFVAVFVAMTAVLLFKPNGLLGSEA